MVLDDNNYLQRMLLLCKERQTTTKSSSFEKRRPNKSPSVSILSNNNNVEDSRLMKRESRSLERPKVSSSVSSYRDRNGMDSHECIVGSRPKHWGPTTPLPPRHKSKTPQSSSSSLTQATKRPLMTPITDPARERRKRALMAATAPPPSINDNQQHENDATPSQSFCPSSLFSRSKKSSRDDIIANEEGNEFNSSMADCMTPLSQIIQHAAMSSRKKKRKSTSNQFLKRELKTLRNKVDSDVGRLRHSAALHDLNDPRNRAEFYVDVEILDLALTTRPMTTGHIVFTGFVSNQCFTDKRNATPEETTKRNHPFQCWIYFTCDTAMEHNIKTGMKLRIYDCIIVDGVEDAMPCIICTQLCEPCPKDISCDDRC